LERLNRRVEPLRRLDVGWLSGNLTVGNRAGGEHDVGSEQRFPSLPAFQRLEVALDYVACGHAQLQQGFEGCQHSRPETSPAQARSFTRHSYPSSTATAVANTCGTMKNQLHAMTALATLPR